jgi:hypothetical protein
MHLKNVLYYQSPLCRSPGTSRILSSDVVAVPVNVAVLPTGARRSDSMATHSPRPVVNALQMVIDFKVFLLLVRRRCGFRCHCCTVSTGVFADKVHILLITAAIAPPN